MASSDGYQWHYRGMAIIKKKAFSLKTRRSKVMASFTHLESLRHRFRDPSAATLLKKPIATVSLHRQRTSGRQLIATPTLLSHVRATR